MFRGDWVRHKRALSILGTGQQTDRLLMKHRLHFSSCLYSGFPGLAGSPSLPSSTRHGYVGGVAAMSVSASYNFKLE